MSADKPLPQQDGLANHAKELRATSRKGTGPRTLVGKSRSKYNAVRHGLFAKAVLLEHESQSQLDALLHGLEQDFMPRGMWEQIQVEMLAADLWRCRRLRQVESAEMQKNIDHVETERESRAETIRVTLEEHQAKTNRIGVLRDIEDCPESFQRCLEGLCLVRSFVEIYGFDRSYSIELGFLYGARYSGRPGKDLFDFYLECLSALKATPAERKKRGFASEEDCTQRFIKEAEREIRRLERLCKDPRARQRSSPQLNANEIVLPACEVLDSSEMDALLRCQASIERSIDRTLNRLEGRQRMRSGDPVAKLEVQHSMS